MHCMHYLLHTAVGTPLPLSGTDHLLFNFGLHDYNRGMAGVAQYGTELQDIVVFLQQRQPAKLAFVLTTPAHNTPAPDNEVVVALNRRAATIMAAAGIPIIDLYTPIMAECGPVPWADSGPKACLLCAPNCKSLAVHYTATGYNFIANIVAKALLLLG